MAKKKTQKESPTGTNAYSDSRDHIIAPPSTGPITGSPALQGVTLREIRRKDPEPPVYFPAPKEGEVRAEVKLLTYGVEIYKPGGEFLFIPWASVIDMNGTYQEP